MAAIGTVMPAPKFTAYDDNGDPVSGGLLYTYEAGTTTPVGTFSDVELTILNSNPVVFDAGGRATVFLAPGSYKFVLATAANVEIWSQDNVSSVAPFNVDLDVFARFSEDIAEGDAVFMATGAEAGPLVAGRWYLTDATDPLKSSEAFIVGVSPTAFASGDQGSVRLIGTVEMPGPLVAGAAYYASDVTPGAITTTPPADNVRFIGQADTTTTLIVRSPKVGSGTPGFDYIQLQVFA